MPEMLPLPVTAVATVVLLLLHVPPVVASPKDIDEPAQTTAGPLIDGGIGLTVTGLVLKQPELSM